jgi:hypothetical protein
VNTKPHCPYPCAGSYCPYIRSDAECIACEARPRLDDYFQALDDWKTHQAREDHTGVSHPYNSPALAGWGGGEP